MSLVAALPMYDWPERRTEVDAEWAAIRVALRAAGIDAPGLLARRNADMPAVPGGIRNAEGIVVAPDPAALDPDGFDLPVLWRHPDLLLAQTCWGPMEATDLASSVSVIAQQDYAGCIGGEGSLYSSTLVMHAEDQPGADAIPRADGAALLPIERLRGARLAFNDPHSRSGILALRDDLRAVGEDLPIFSSLIETGGHRLSLRAVAMGHADLAAIDCRSWSLARRHEPLAAALRVVGWTARRPGLPFICARAMPEAVVSTLRGALSRMVRQAPQDGQ